jgi:acyl carrier protein
MDALAHYRQSAGLPATSINWGAWGEVGMAAGLDALQQSKMAGRGVALIDPERGVLALERALANGDAQTAVLPVRWAALLEQFPAGQIPPLFAELARATPPRPSRPAPAGDDAAAFRQRLAGASAKERNGLLVERLALHVARVMGMDARSVEPNRPLGDLGIDSLMAVELKNRIDGDLRTSIPVTTLLAGPSIEELAAELGANGDEMPKEPASPSTSSHMLVGQAERPEQLLANLDQLSDDDVNALLGAMLKDQEGA